MNSKPLLAALTIGAIVLIVGAVILATRYKSSPDSAIAGPPPGAYRGSEPGGRIELPRFDLPRYDGSGTLSSASLHGKVVVTTYVDSACTDLCPLIINILGTALHQLTPGERAQIEAVAFSVDPKVDTPAHVRHFLKVRNALGTLDYLVAPASVMQPVWTRFHVLPATATHDANTHSADVRVFNRNGVWVSTLNAQADLTTTNLVHDIRQALKPTF